MRPPFFTPDSGLKQLAKLPQATSPLITQLAKRPRRVVVHVMRMGVASTTDRLCPVSQDNKKRIILKWGNREFLETGPAD
jgi:hypothetical protein